MIWSPFKVSKASTSPIIKEKPSVLCPVEEPSCWRTHGMRKANNAIGQIPITERWPNLLYSRPGHPNAMQEELRGLAAAWSYLQILYSKIREKREEIQRLVADLEAAHVKVAPFGAILQSQAAMLKIRCNRLSESRANYFHLAMFACNICRQEALEIGFSGRAFELRTRSGSEWPWSMPVHGKDGVIYFWQQRAKDIEDILGEEDMVLAIIRGDIPALKEVDYKAQKEEEDRILKAETENSKYGRLFEAVATENRSEAEVHEFRLRLELALSEAPVRDVDRFVTDAVAAAEAAAEAARNAEAGDRIVAHKRREAAVSSLLEISDGKDEMEQADQEITSSSAPGPSHNTDTEVAQSSSESRGLTLESGFDAAVAVECRQDDAERASSGLFSLD